MNSNHRTFDPQREDSYESRYGIDPAETARDEEKRKQSQSPASEYFERTLEKAVKIVDCRGYDGDGRPMVFVLKKGDANFETDGIFSAKKMIRLYLLKLWIDPKSAEGEMKVADKFWRFETKGGHWVEVHHE
jgi:hypothetical protein